MHQLSRTDFLRLKQCFGARKRRDSRCLNQPGQVRGRALKFCLERGYRGRLYPINPGNEIVQGVKAYRAISDLPEAPDIAVIAVPAPQVRECLAAAAEKGCGIAIVYGAQFTESGEAGRRRQDELLRIARSNGMRLLGPNCMGIIALASGFIASFTTAPEHHGGKGWPERGNVSVASQSGAVGIQILAQLRDRGIGLANWISTGNQADIDVADAIAYFAVDPCTDTIAVYLEDASRGLKLVQALELARQARKPVVALKVGTTPEGGQAAAGHTASMYVEDRVVEDMFAQYGVLRARSVNQLIDLAAACNAGVVPESPDIAAVSVSGGGAVMIADAAARRGLNLIEFPQDALGELREANPFVNDRNPIDISAPSMSNMEITGGHLKWGLEREAPSMVGYISHIPLVPRTRAAIMPWLHSFRNAHRDKLIAIAGNFHPEDRRDLVKTGMAVFDDPTAATEAVAELVKAGQAFAGPPVDPTPPSEPGELLELLQQAGIAMAPQTEVGSADDAVALLDGPLVLKLSAPTLEHRTEIGGVETGLDDAMRVRRAFDRLSAVAETARPAHPGIRMVASPQLQGIEILVGVRNDPHFGPLVVLGSGGVDCGIHDDLVYRKAPFDIAAAAAMVDSLRVAPKFDGWRGGPAVDRRAVETALVNLSRLAHRLPSLEVNPAFVSSTGVIGADLVSVSSDIVP